MNIKKEKNELSEKLRHEWAVTIATYVNKKGLKALHKIMDPVESMTPDRIYKALERMKAELNEEKS